MLSLNLETLLERAVTIAFFFWDKPALRVIVGKNLIAHRVRNRKTTVMYALSLAFVILISVLYDLQVSSLRLTVLSLSCFSASVFLLFSRSARCFCVLLFPRSRFWPLLTRH